MEELAQEALFKPSPVVCRSGSTRGVTFLDDEKGLSPSLIGPLAAADGYDFCL
jgi:hypothetical protein